MNMNKTHFQRFPNTTNISLCSCCSGFAGNHGIVHECPIVK